MASLNLEWREAAAWCKALFDEGRNFPAWSDERALYWQESLICFIEWFLQPPLPVPGFHKKWAYLLARYQFLCLMAPRDHAKSSFFSIFVPLWRLCMDRNSTVMLTASSYDIAGLAMRGIKGHLETNDALRAGFGDLRTSAQSWAGYEIILDRPDKSLPHPSVVALGVGAAVLTRRVVNGMIVADDLATEENTRSDAQREHLIEWVNATLIPVLEPEEQIIFIGTRKGDDDLYSTFAENPAYHFETYDAIVDERADGSWQTLWEDKWSEEALRQRLLVNGTIIFNRNYRNIVLSDADSPFPLHWFTGEQGTRGCYDYDAHIWGEDYVSTLRKVQSIDLAISSADKASYFIILTLGMDERGDIRLLNLLRAHLPDFVEQVRRAIDLYDRFLPEYVIVENNGYQEAFLQALVSPAFGKPEMPVIPHTTTRKKHDAEEGIYILQPICEAGRLRLPMGDPESRAISEMVVSELNRLGVAKHDDIVLALWFAVTRLLGAPTRGRAQARTL